MTKQSVIKLLPAVLCFILAFGFRFLLIGYGIMALLFAGIGICIILYIYLPRKLKIVLSCLLLIGVLVLIAAEIPVIKASKGNPDADANYLIVLGAGVNGTSPSLSMVNRLTAAKDYLETHPDCIAIVSGGQGPGEDITEAQAMYTALVASGIAPERLLLEERSTSTAENLAFSREILQAAGLTSDSVIAVVTNDFHQFRTQLIAEDLGMVVVGIPAELPWWWLNANYYVREFFALGKLWMVDLFS